MSNDHVLKAWELAQTGPEIEFAKGGPTHQLASVRMLSVAQKLEFERLITLRNRLRLRAMGQKLTKAQAEQYEAFTDKLARIVLPSLSDDEFAALSHFDKDLAVMVFTGASEDTLTKLGEATERAMGNLDPEEDLEILAS